MFEEFIPKPKIEVAEERCKFYARIFTLYGIVGNITYACLPLFSVKKCMENKTKHMIKHGIPCGAIGRCILPFKYDYFPVTQIVIVEEILVSTLGTLNFILLS
ncbi:hypothetical protein NQ314_003850 [Rhamnusium bicolor]|uniref:Uncharacterized protein n=1 Tax=Rhamnusium bicolor TaxID=1586634 RepID=A0AAV8ZP96_9CUCU|nr:hypothetical protein NQ314_003850 [Rhamnusium bicolor]